MLLRLRSLTISLKKLAFSPCSPGALIAIESIEREGHFHGLFELHSTFKMS